MPPEQLVYISRATSPPCSGDVAQQIAAEPLIHNPRNNITGALAYTDTHYVQILEGSVGSLDVLLLRLLFDERHTCLEVLDRVRISECSFLGWAMITPVMTQEGSRDLLNLIAEDARTMSDYRALLLTLCASQMGAELSAPV